MPFNIGPGELLLLAVVALLLFGPRRLPEIGRSVGEGIASFKKAMNSVTEVPLPAPARPPAAQAAPVGAAAAALPPTETLPALETMPADPAPEGSLARAAEAAIGLGPRIEAEPAAEARTEEQEVEPAESASA